MAGNRRKLGVVERTRQTAVSALNGFVRFWKPVVVIAVAATVVTGTVKTVEHLSRTGRFVLRHVDVLGTSRLDVVDIEEICGLETGVTNVFTTDSDEVALDCLDDDRIEAASVSRILPDRIRIRVREARPALFARSPTGLHSFDGMGRRHFKVGIDWEPSLPVLVGVDSLLDPVEFPAPPYETVNQKKDRLAAQQSAYERNTIKAGRIVVDAVRLLTSMEVSYPGWLADGVLIEYNDALGFKLLMPDRPALAVGFPPYDKRLATLDQTMTAIEQKNLRVDEVFIDNNREPGLVSARWSKPDKGVAVTSVVTLE